MLIETLMRMSAIMLAVVSLLYAVYWYCRVKGVPVFISNALAARGYTPAAIQKKAAPGVVQTGLKIESALNIDARKRLLVVSSGNERFMLSVCGDALQLLTPLQVIDGASENSDFDIVEANTPETPATRQLTASPDVYPVTRAATATTETTPRARARTVLPPPSAQNARSSRPNPYWKGR